MTADLRSRIISHSMISHEYFTRKGKWYRGEFETSSSESLGPAQSSRERLQRDLENLKIGL